MNPTPTAPHPVCSAGVGKRVHAWCLANLTGRYEPLVAERKTKLLGGLRGTVLEIGPGTGPNLQFYSKHCRWIGIEPNPYMHPYLQRSAETAGIHIEVGRGIAEQLPVDDTSVDAVVATLVLCSVKDPEIALREILRVLKPGGRFVFIEHVAAADGTRLRTVQRWIRPIWSRLADGCHPDRDTGGLIRQAAFTSVCYQGFRLPLGPVSPQIAGFAEK